MNAPQICNYSGKKWKTLKFRASVRKDVRDNEYSFYLDGKFVEINEKISFIFSFKIKKPKYSIYSIYSTFKLNLKSKNTDAHSIRFVKV